MSVMGHQSYITTSVTGASGSLVEGAVFGQLGFAQQSPWYLTAETSYTGLPSAPRDNGFRAAGGLGWEGKHLAFEGRGGIQEITGSDVGIVSFGGSVMYRFLPLVRLWGSEENLSLDDQQALLKERMAARERQESMAPELKIEFDQYALSDALSLGEAQIERIRASLKWKFQPWFWLIPIYEGYVYSFSGARSAIDPALASRHFRPSRLSLGGPHAWYSGAFGPVAAVIRIATEMQLTFHTSLSASIARIELNNGRAFGSFWVQYHRSPDELGKWALTPGFEHVRSGADHYSFFTLTLSRIPKAPYRP